MLSILNLTFLVWLFVLQANLNPQISFNSDAIDVTMKMSTQRPTRVETTGTTESQTFKGKKLIAVFRSLDSLNK